MYYSPQSGSKTWGKSPGFPVSPPVPLGRFRSLSLSPCGQCCSDPACQKPAQHTQLLVLATAASASPQWFFHKHGKQLWHGRQGHTPACSWSFHRAGQSRGAAGNEKPWPPSAKRRSAAGSGMLLRVGAALSSVMLPWLVLQKGGQRSGTCLGWNGLRVGFAYFQHSNTHFNNSTASQ